MQVAVRREFERLTAFGPTYVLAVVTALGVVAYALFIWADRQLQTGLGVTGMNQPTYWGAYIVNFVFLVGLSAGGIVVSGLVHAFKVEQYRAVARIAEVVAIACILMAGIFISLDVGRPDRLWHLARYGRWQSPLIWDVFIVNAYLLMALALGYFSTRADIVKCMRAMPSRASLYRLLALGYVDDSPAATRRDETALRVLAWASIPTAILLHSVTAWILGLTKATPGWHTALLAPVFIGSALASGLSLVTLVSFVSQRLFQAEVSDETIAALGRLILLSIPLLGYFLLSELLTVVYAREVSPSAFFEELMTGQYAVFFWFDLMVGLITPLIILACLSFWPRRLEDRVVVTQPLAWRTVTATFAAAAVVLLALAMLVDTSRERVSFSVELWSVSGTPLTIVLSAAAGVFFVFLSLRLSAAAGVALASVLVVAGVLAERINIVLAPQLTRFSPHPDELFAFPYTVADYRPTWEEMSITLGVYCLGILGFLVFAKVFPLTELPEEPAPEPRWWPGFEEELPEEPTA